MPTCTETVSYREIPQNNMDLMIVLIKNEVIVGSSCSFNESMSGISNLGRVPTEGTDDIKTDLEGLETGSICICDWKILHFDKTFA